MIHVTAQCPQCQARDILRESPCHGDIFLQSLQAALCLQAIRASSILLTPNISEKRVIDDIAGTWLEGAHCSLRRQDITGAQLLLRHSYCKQEQILSSKSHSSSLAYRIMVPNCKSAQQRMAEDFIGCWSITLRTPSCNWAQDAENH